MNIRRIKLRIRGWLFGIKYRIMWRLGITLEQKYRKTHQKLK